MEVTSITYNIDGAVLTIAHDSPGVVLMDYTDLDGVGTHTYHEIDDAKTAHAAANEILGTHYGLVGDRAKVTRSTLDAFIVTLEDMAEA